MASKSVEWFKQGVWMRQMTDRETDRQMDNWADRPRYEEMGSYT